MCSELFRIPYEWAGVPIFGFGVLLAIWAVVCAVAIAGIVQRFGWSAETWSSLPVLLAVGAAIVLLPRVFPDGLPVRGYGVMLLAGIVAGVALAMHRARQVGLDPEAILSMAFWLVLSGIVGARLFYVIEYWEKFAGRSPRQTLVEIVNVPQGGLVIYGGLIGAAVGVTIFVLKHKLPLLATADLIAPSLVVGLALGRVGCFLNGCCYGGQSDWPWAVTFPRDSSPFLDSDTDVAQSLSPPYADQAARGELHGFRLESRNERPAVVTRVDSGSPADLAGLQVGDEVTAIDREPIDSLAEAKHLILQDFLAQQALHLKLRPGTTLEVSPVTPPPRSKPVHPTQLYSAIDAGILAWLLWSYYPLRRRDGEVIALLLTIHPVTRFLLEVIRTDEPAVFGTGMSISQNISLLLVAFAGLLWWHILRMPRGVAWPLAAQAASPPQKPPNRRRRRS